MIKRKPCVICPAEARHLYKTRAYCSTCINTVPADAPITSIDFRVRGHRRQIQEVQADKNYSGESSPYWDQIHTTQDTTGEGMGVLEDPIANPDVLPEDSAIFIRPLSELGEVMMRAVRETMDELTDQQKLILQLATDGVWTEHGVLRTEDAIADQVGRSRRAVRDCLNRVKAKIRRRYENLKAAEV